MPTLLKGLGLPVLLAILFVSAKAVHKDVFSLKPGSAIASVSDAVSNDDRLKSNLKKCLGGKTDPSGKMPEQMDSEGLTAALNRCKGSRSR